MKARILAPALCLLAALPAFAETRIIAALSGDWNGDGNPDAVLLMAPQTGDIADLVVMEGDGYSGLHPVLEVPQAVWGGRFAGQTPGLEPHRDTSFILHTQQTGIGRTPWEQRITVAWRGGNYLVAGFDTHFYDRNDPSRGGTCSVNLLTGDYMLRYGPGNEAPEIETAGRGDDRAFPLAELTESWQPAVCAPLFR
ncbi:MAG: hypothetical protein ACK4GT_11030 [Pararhodobacter sp.]